MPSTFTQNLGLEKPATGEQAGSWGTTANFNYDVLDAAIDGGVSISLAVSPYTLQTNINGAGPPAQGVNKLITCTGAQSAAGALNIAPSSVQKIYIVQNQTTGGFPITIQQPPTGGGAAGASVSLQAGYAAIVYADGGAGSNSPSVTLAFDSPQFTNLMVTGDATVQGNITVHGVVNFGGSGVVQIDQAVGIGIGLTPGHSLMIGGSVIPEVWLDVTDPTQQTRQVVWSRGGSPRWAIQTPVAAESGANAGSNLQWASFSDAGNPLRVALFMNRATGNLAIGAGSDQNARLAVIGDNAAQTVLGARGAAGQSAPVLLCQDSASNNLMLVDVSGNVRLTGTLVVQRGAAPTTLYFGLDGTYNVIGSDNQSHAFHFVGGILVAVL